MMKIVSSVEFEDVDDSDNQTERHLITARVDQEPQIIEDKQQLRQQKLDSISESNQSNLTYDLVYKDSQIDDTSQNKIKINVASNGSDLETQCK